LDSKNNLLNFKVKDSAEILQNGKSITLSQIPINISAKITVLHNQITKINILPKKYLGQEDTQATGIVEDNNPLLSYISLYNADGLSNQSNLRTYYYDPELVEVEKNHKKADIDSIEPGDTVYLELGDDNKINKISGIDNLETAYATIISKKPTYMAVEYDDGSQQILDVAPNIVVVLDQKLIPYDNLKEGDTVKLMLQKTPELTSIKQIITYGDSNNVSNIYKANLQNLDLSHNQIILNHPQKFYKGQWQKLDQYGFLVLKPDNSLKVYANQQQLTSDKVNKHYLGNEVYVTVKRGFGNQEIASFIAFNNSTNKEVLYDDTISSLDSGSRQIRINKSFDVLNFTDDTIVIKDGYLVNCRSLSPSDAIYAVANRDLDSGQINANVIVTQKSNGLSSIQVVRGKIYEINADKNFTLENFSTLNKLTWDYTPYPKTFAITYDTRVFGDEGVLGVRDFVYTSYFAGKSVYVIANETQALLVSTAPYGAFNVKGTVTDSSVDYINLGNASIYDKDTLKWNEQTSILNLIVIPNTIIIKNGKITTMDNIEKGDIVRILKKDNTAKGDAYVIMVEK
jgi:hypothetical protein